MVALVAHNSFISVMVEQGIIGLSIFLALFLSLFIRSLHMSGPVRSLWIISLLTWSVGVMDLTWEYRKPTWFLFGMIAAISVSPKIQRPRGRIKHYDLRHRLKSSPVAV